MPLATHLRYNRHLVIDAENRSRHVFSSVAPFMTRKGGDCCNTPASDVQPSARSIRVLPSKRARRMDDHRSAIAAEGDRHHSYPSHQGQARSQRSLYDALDYLFTSDRLSRDRSPRSTQFRCSLEAERKSEAPDNRPTERACGKLIPMVSSITPRQSAAPATDVVESGRNVSWRSTSTHRRH